ncbi:MAG: hypothetical protein JRI23_03260 [Deltaproteobacteria bacterium]|jgi:hypothetical protein|nr:hypothetical protein [Deltaproteobacteria bacterium]MBW2530528.1 hypothetical protein [Deltaproteobacteria bacterium]
MAALEQWVNIARDGKWVEDDVTSEQRLGPVHLEVKLKKALPTTFSIKVEPTGDQATYTDAEKGRNANFELQGGQGSFANEGKKKVLLDSGVFLPAAGGNEFTVKAKCGDKEVEASKTVVSRRRLFYQSCKMQGLHVPQLSDMEKAYWDESDFYIKLIKKADGTMPFVKAFYRDDGSGGSNFDVLARQAKNAWALQARMPYAFMLIWVNQLPIGAQKNIKKTVDVKLPSKLWTWSWKGLSFEFRVGDFLWYGLDDTHDAAQHWLVSVEVKFRDKDNRITRLPIPDDRISIAGDPVEAHGGYNKIKVDLSADDLAGIRNRFTQRTGKMRFVIKVRTAHAFMNGFALDLVNMVVIATKAGFRITTDAKRKYTANHEVGHKIGMVADGTGRLPDAPSSLYGNVTAGPGENNKGHNGTHCETGGTWNATTKKWSGSPGCVMFGSDCIVDGGRENDAPKTYCDSCKPIVRKLDVSAPMPGFANTPKNL